MTTTGQQPRYSPAWLSLRESADAAARAMELLDPLRERLGRSPTARPGSTAPRVVVHDLGCGTGSMGRWLAGRLPGPQHWVLHDRDPDLLRQAAATMAVQAAGGVDGVAPGDAPVTVETRVGDVTRLSAADLAGADLVTASALLDLLTAEEVESLAAACVAAGCPALFTMSVVGWVELTPADPLDAEIVAGFNAHQRRETGGRRLLGPDAVNAVAAAFARRDASVLVRPALWYLGPRQAELAAEWLRGWVAAAVEERPDLAGPATSYERRRLAAASAGDLRVVVHHADLLALPR